MYHVARLVLAAGLAVAAAGAASAQSGTITARLRTIDGVDAGKVTFLAMRAGVLVRVELTDLPPGPHAIHIHQTGACNPDFEAAGEHLSPDGSGHGFAATEHPHAGDLPNIYVADSGAVTAEFLDWRLAMEDLLDDDGSAVIVHAQSDTYMDPASAGERIVCGVVEQQG